MKTPAASPRAHPLTIAIAALGGQGGGVLADWLVSTAEASGYIAQYTSVQGVAQRTGTTIYYIELFPRAEAAAKGREPVLALYPVPGDVDIVLAAELMEAGRAVSRGFVTPDRTTLIASSHRVYAVDEKAVLGDGRVDGASIEASLRAAARRLVLFDMESLAERQGSVISAVLLGALAASGAAPLSRPAFEQVIRASGVAVERSLAAFAAGFEAAAETRDAGAATVAAEPDAGGVPVRSAEHPLVARLRRTLPEPVHDFALEGLRRVCDFQDHDYGSLYLDRLERLHVRDREAGGATSGFAFTREIARHLALWMTYQDVIRVADLKTRGARFARFRADVRAGTDQIVTVTEYVHPRLEEALDVLPAGVAERIERSSWITRLLRPLFRDGRRIASNRIGGFLLFHAVGRLRPWRPRSRRFAAEQRQIEQWLDHSAKAVAIDPAVGLEVARLPRLLKGYGDTWARGRANFETIMALSTRLESLPGAAKSIAALAEAALRDEDGRALAVERRRAEALIAGASAASLPLEEAAQ